MTDKPTKEIIYGKQVWTVYVGRTWRSTEKEINCVKATGLDEIPPEVWKASKFGIILLRLCNAAYEQNAIENDWNAASSSFPRNPTFYSFLLRTTEA